MPPSPASVFTRGYFDHTYIRLYRSLPIALCLSLCVCLFLYMAEDRPYARTRVAPHRRSEKSNKRVGLRECSCPYKSMFTLCCTSDLETGGEAGVRLKPWGCRPPGIRIGIGRSSRSTRSNTLSFALTLAAAADTAVGISGAPFAV